MGKVRTKSGWLGDEVGTWVSYNDYKELEAQLRDIALMAKPVAATAKNTSAVRTGHELGGYIKHYIVPTHLITAIKGEE